MYAPIVIFAYARPEHIRLTIESLLRNPQARHSKCIIYSDSAVSDKLYESVKQVRNYLASVNGFLSVKIIERPNNYGLSSNIIDGVTETCNRYGRAIILEDDMVVSPYFLEYMNQALDRYEQDDRVASIHGYMYPVCNKLPESFFLPGADCWGWATWQRAWQLFNPDGRLLLRELERTGLLKVFNFNGAYPFSKMLKNQIIGINDSWAIRWYASTLLAGKLTLYPGRSLVHNIGNDGSGTHCQKSSFLDAVLSQRPINLGQPITIEPCWEARGVIEAYLRNRGSIDKIGFLRSAFAKIRNFGS